MALRPRSESCHTVPLDKCKLHCDWFMLQSIVQDFYYILQSLTNVSHVFGLSSN